MTSQMRTDLGRALPAAVLGQGVRKLIDRLQRDVDQLVRFAFRHDQWRGKAENVAAGHGSSDQAFLEAEAGKSGPDLETGIEALARRLPGDDLDGKKHAFA